MDADDAKVANALIIYKLCVEEAGGIFNEFDVGAVHLGEGLLILALDEDLGFCLQGGKGVAAEVFEREKLCRRL